MWLSACHVCCIYVWVCVYVHIAVCCAHVCVWCFFGIFNADKKRDTLAGASRGRPCVRFHARLTEPLFIPLVGGGGGEVGVIFQHFKALFRQKVNVCVCVCCVTQRHFSKYMLSYFHGHQFFLRFYSNFQNFWTIFDEFNYLIIHL